MSDLCPLCASAIGDPGTAPVTCAACGAVFTPTPRAFPGGEPIPAVPVGFEVRDDGGRLEIRWREGSLATLLFGLVFCHQRIA